MRETYSLPPSVVVGIDGSRAAVRAALWAVDAAVSRDIPLRLVVRHPPGRHGRDWPPGRGTQARRGRGRGSQRIYGGRVNGEDMFTIHAQPYGSRIRHEDEKNPSAILMRILQPRR